MKYRRYLLIIALLCASPVPAVFTVGSLLSSPSPAAIGIPTTGLDVESVNLEGPADKRISGWFIEGQEGRGGILLLHSIRSDRREMISRARFLHQAGYSVLLVDFQAHGESPGERITFGHRESRDVVAAYDYLQGRLQDRPIGIIGVSLGGAATLLSPIAHEADALVLESVYPTLEAAVTNRLALHLGPPGRLLTPLLTWQLELRFGIDPDRLRPIERIATVRTPVLIVAGSEDRHTTMAESRRLFEAAAGPKRFWRVEGAGHENFHSYRPERYEQQVLGFFRQYLDSGAETVDPLGQKLPQHLLVDLPYRNRTAQKRQFDHLIETIFPL